MKKVVAVLEGEKLGLEKVTRENKVNVSLHMLAGYESVKMSVRDNNLVSAIEALPNRKPIKVKAEVQTYKDELYLQALAVIS